MIAFLLVAECAIRITGITDFPVYEKDLEIGYIQRANQEGTFLNRNSWRINQLHMFGDDFDISDRPYTLLLGDSVVWGGNPYRREDRLGVILEGIIGARVWSVAAGSWSSWSATAYMERYPEVTTNADQVVWVFNSGDFSEPTVWNSEATHPTRRPVVGLWYVINKYALRRLSGRTTRSPSPQELIDEDQVGRVSRLIQGIAERGQCVVIVLWPSQRELVLHETRALRYYPLARRFESIQDGGVVFLDMSKDPRVRRSLYRDGIHLTPGGNRVLASIIAEQLIR